MYRGLAFGILSTNHFSQHRRASEAKLFLNEDASLCRSKCAFSVSVQVQSTTKFTRVIFISILVKYEMNSFYTNLS